MLKVPRKRRLRGVLWADDSFEWRYPYSRELQGHIRTLARALLRHRAVREGIPLTVIVFNDGALGQIRLQQLSSFGIAHATNLLNPDFAFAVGIPRRDLLLLEGDAEDVLRRALGTPGVSLIEVRLGDSLAIHLCRAHGAARETARRLLRPACFRPSSTASVSPASEALAYLEPSKL